MGACFSTNVPHRHHVAPLPSRAVPMSRAVDIPLVSKHTESPSRSNTIDDDLPTPVIGRRNAIFEPLSVDQSSSETEYSESEIQAVYASLQKLFQNSLFQGLPVEQFDSHCAERVMSRAARFALSRDEKVSLGDAASTVVIVVRGCVSITETRGLKETISVHPAVSVYSSTESVNAPTSISVVCGSEEGLILVTSTNEIRSAVASRALSFRLRASEVLSAVYALAGKSSIAKLTDIAQVHSYPPGKTLPQFSDHVLYLLKGSVKVYKRDTRSGVELLMRDISRAGELLPTCRTDEWLVSQSDGCEILSLNSAAASRLLADSELRRS